MLETYAETPTLIMIDVTEDVVEFSTRKLLGSLGPEETESKALQGWILKFGEE